MESYYLSILIAGFGGGVVRGLVGFVKHQFKFKNVKFNLEYFTAMMFISGVIGILTAVAVKEIDLSILGLDIVSPGVAFILGYAGGDIVENLYKIIFRKDSIFDLMKK